MSTEIEGLKPSTIEEKIAAVGLWLDSMSASSEVGVIDPGVLKETLANFGANFENLSDEALVSLDPAGYSNVAKKPGIEAIWGDRYTIFRAWAKKFAEDYEERTGLKLPTVAIIKDGREVGKSKISGMTQFFSQLTEFAAGTLPFSDFKLFTEVRIKNGKSRAEGRSEDIIRVNVPNSNKPRAISSVPPGFVNDMFNYLKSS